MVKTENIKLDSSQVSCVCTYVELKVFLWFCFFKYYLLNVHD